MEQYLLDTTNSKYIKEFEAFRMEMNEIMLHLMWSCKKNALQLGLNDINVYVIVSIK